MGLAFKGFIPFISILKQPSSLDFVQTSKKKKKNKKEQRSMEGLIFRKQYFFPSSTSDKMTASDSHENEKHLLKFKNSKQKKRRHILHGHSSAHSKQVFAQRIKVCNNSNPLKNVYIKFTFLFLHFIFLYLLANKEPNTSENLPISCS